MATIFSVTYRMYKSVTECPVCTFQWVFRKNISVNKILLIFTFYWHRICIAPPVFSLILQCLLWKIWIIAWNISACLANITSLCQGQHFPIFCSPPPKWIYNISITSHCAKCSWGHKCCGDKYKVFFPSDFSPQIMLNVSGLISSFLPMWNTPHSCLCLIFHLEQSQYLIWFLPVFVFSSCCQLIMGFYWEKFCTIY